MKFSQTRPVKIVMLGAGGTGGHIAPHLYRLLYSLERPVRFIICDGDVVEEKNLVRQNFIQADLGENKAKVLAERYSTVFGLETEYVPSFVEKEDDLRRLLKPDHWRIDRKVHLGAGHSDRRSGQQQVPATLPLRFSGGEGADLHRQRERRVYRPGSLWDTPGRQKLLPAYRSGLPGCAGGYGQIPNGAVLR